MSVTPTNIKPPKQPRRNLAFKRLMSVHWWMARLYSVLFVGGWFMTHLPRENLVQEMLYDGHKTIGVLTVAMLTWRILVLLQVWWRKYTRHAAKMTSAWLQKFALHTLLYLLMWAVPVSGVFLSNSYQAENVRFVGIVLPDIFPQNAAVVELARSLHFWAAYTFLAFIALHIVAQRKVLRSHWRHFRRWLRAKQP